MKRINRIRKIIPKKSFFTLAIIFVWMCSFCFSQETTYTAGMNQNDSRIRTSDEGFAEEEFRRGVQAYYKGSFNEAIVQFEKALSYLPNDNLILEWLGNTYYKSGLEGSALSCWNTAAENGYGGLLLQNKIEIVRERRVTGDSSEKLMRLSEAGNFYGTLNGNLIFSGPVSVLANKDGTIWITSYNTNELLKLNLNGTVLERVTGPLTGFDRPLDIIRLASGKILVSESAGDRIALLSPEGHFEKYIGERGRGNGCVVGPQYLAEDELGRIYVTDFGNRRIDVFDSDGNGLFFFGNRRGDFKGLKCPTGIAVVNESVFVADDEYGCIFEFDRSGNYLRKLVQDDTFKKPEAIKYNDDSLIVCDENRLVSVQIDSGALFELARTGNAPSRITAACVDVNKNVIVTDYSAEEIYVMSPIQELVGGLFVQIENIDASAFPNVTVELKVENRHRQPVVGLQTGNFYLSENKRPVSKLTFDGAVSNNTYADLTLIIDRSVSTAGYKNEIETAVKEIVSSAGEKSTVRIISAGAIPVIEYVGKASGLENFSVDALKGTVSSKVSTDLAIRLAVNDLINAAKKRAVIMISDGAVTADAFSKYTLAELSAYMNNNSIGFSFVQVSQKAVAAEYDYLFSNTNGDSYYVFRPEGLKTIVSDIIDIPQGVYQLSYVSALQTNFGENFLPVEAEVYLLNRRGRDERGYFAPLQ